MGTRTNVGLPVAEELEALHRRLAPITDGTIASYIPALDAADPSWFGICIATIDGKIYDVGDSAVPFTIQSISKAFTYGMALDHHGTADVLARVGVEPTGDPFNSISVDESTRRPFNPMVNAGAILTTSLLPGDDAADRRRRMLDGFGRFLGHPPQIDPEVFGSERETGNRNRAIAYFLRTFEMLPEDVDEILDLYFEQCSILVDCRDLAVMGATLANEGLNPLTGERAVDQEHVASMLSVMATCGMYDFAGEWFYRVGMPAKSGVAGGIVAVLPGQLGIGVFSPPLDARGNSARGIAVCDALSRDFGLHFFRTPSAVSSVIRRTYRGDLVRSKRVRAANQAAALRSNGERITILELQGDIVFASAELISRAVADQLDSSWFVVLDTRRVGSVDAAATKILGALRELAVRHDTRIVAAGRAHTFDALTDRVLQSLDEALEWCEDQILDRVGIGTAVSLEVRIEQHELFVGLDSHELDALVNQLQATRFSKGDVIFEEGDAAASMYLLTSGCVSVHLEVDGHRRRLATLEPGSAFGEMAVLDGGTRSTTVVADEESICLILTTDALRELDPQVPALTRTLYANLARSLSRRLREANLEIRALDS